MSGSGERTVACPYCGTLSVVGASEIKDFVCPACGSKAVLSNGGTTILIESGTIEDSLIGSKLGGYRIERLLGSGGMGRVYYAVQEAVDRPVALKVLAPSLVENVSLKKRFIMEAKAAGRMLHPHIVTVFDAGEVDGTAFIAMEYVDGVSLAQKVFESGRLSVDEALRIIRQIATALSYAFTCKVIHRDIKPANILIRKDGVAKLADMGLAKRLDLPGVTMPGAVMGTPFYMAPEQAVDSASVDHRADIYSLGATLYHAVVGRVPFEGASTIEVLAKQKMQPLQFPKDVSIPQGVRNLINKMMAKEPEKRFQSWEEVIAAIDELTEKEKPPLLKRMLKVFLFGVSILIVLLAFLFLVHLGSVEDSVKSAEEFYLNNPDSPDEAFRRFFALIPAAADTQFLARVLSGAKTALQSLTEKAKEHAERGNFEEAVSLLEGEFDALGIPEAEDMLKKIERLRREIDSYRMVYDVETFYKRNPGKSKEVLERCFKLLPSVSEWEWCSEHLLKVTRKAFERLRKDVIEAAQNARFADAEALLRVESDAEGVPEAERLLKQLEKLRVEVKRYRALYKRAGELLMTWKQRKFANIVDFVDPALRKREDVRKGLFVVGLAIAFSELRSFNIGKMSIEGDLARVRVEMEIARRTKDRKVIKEKVSDDLKFIYKGGVWYIWTEQKKPLPTDRRPRPRMKRKP